MKALVALALLSGSLEASQSPVIDEGIGKARQEIFAADGWRAFRARNGRSYSCFAYKLAEGETSEALVRGSGMALGMIGGRTRGFKLYIKDSSDTFEYGLFGREFYVGVTALEANGQIYNAIYSFGDIKMPQLLALDGQRAEIEITTYEYESRIGRSDRYSGYLDFTGLRSAHQALVDCHNAKNPI